MGDFTLGDASAVLGRHINKYPYPIDSIPRREEKEAIDGIKKIEISIMDDGRKIVNMFANVNETLKAWMHCIVPAERSVIDVLDKYICRPGQWKPGKYIIEEEL